jgi:SNF2 family DNA or RNA helicase
LFLIFLGLLEFLDDFFAMSALQFSSLEEFQQEFRDINQEEQVQRLHKMLAPHLLRRK